MNNLEKEILTTERSKKIISSASNKELLVEIVSRIEKGEFPSNKSMFSHLTYLLNEIEKPGNMHHILLFNDGRKDENGERKIKGFYVPDNWFNIKNREEHYLIGKNFFYNIQEKNETLENNEKNLNDSAYLIENLNSVAKNTLIEELNKRGNFVIIEDEKYVDYDNIIIREVKESLSGLSLDISGEVKDDKVIIFLKNQCYNEEDGKGLRLPLIQVPADTKNIEKLCYLSWGNGKSEENIGWPTSIWERKLVDYNRIYEVDFLEDEIKYLGFSISYEDKGQQKILNINCPRCKMSLSYNLIKKDNNFSIDKKDLKHLKDIIKNH